MQALASINWNELVNGPTPAIMLMFAMIGGVMGTWIVATQWRRVRIAEAEAGLKIRLVERGYSADEMRGILESRLEPARPRRRWLRKARSARTSDFLK